MIELILGAALSLISLLIGFNLGRTEKPLPPKVQEQLTEIFKKKIVPPVEVGAVSRPNQDQIDHWRNPKLTQEEQQMEATFNKLNNIG